MHTHTHKCDVISNDSLVPRLSQNVNMYRAESLVSFLHKHDVNQNRAKTERQRFARCSTKLNQLCFNARCV